MDESAAGDVPEGATGAGWWLGSGAVMGIVVTLKFTLTWLSSNLMTSGKSFYLSETRFSLLESKNHNSAHSEACVVVKITE